jgi:hypothetical protein
VESSSLAEPSSLSSVVESAVPSPGSVIDTDPVAASSSPEPLVATSNTNTNATAADTPPTASALLLGLLRDWGVVDGVSATAAT